ncbi:MAG: hypothetical protein GXP16_01430 [Gammaproteobacteria bacterium]|nr:hypothetical protein [Gammaproteobacteria bacterium]
MGTNYYWHEKSSPCDKCGHDEAKEIHIGKSSNSWVFFLHVDSEEGIFGLTDWVDRFAEDGSYIMSEYGTRIPGATMLAVILERKNTENSWSAETIKRNHAKPGPSGLYRGIDHRHFDPPDPDTDVYDLVEGEFC